ncbi:MAG: dihydroneopterin aldolase [Gammaproteobacteria bacterium]|nr:MAG: dihydroneopterin aldolase [Gammaproteobacteria bacterium]
MDIVYLHDLKVRTTIGAFEWERHIKQTLSLDLDMGFDIRKAGRSDRLADTLNYKAVAKRVTSFVEASEYELVETLAEKVTEIIIGEFDVNWVRLRVNKHGAVSGAGDVGVLIERNRDSRP